MTTKLSEISLLVFKETPERPSFVTIGGTDALGKRIQGVSVATDKAAHAARPLLRPALDAVEAKAAANFAAFEADLKAAQDAAKAAFVRFQKANRRIFDEASGQAVNQTLDAAPAPRPEAALDPSGNSASGEARAIVLEG